MRLIVMLLLLMGLSGCGGRDRTGEWYTDWDRAGGCAGDPAPTPWGLAADGKPLGLCDDYEGYYVWVTYVAGWCRASRQQAAVFAPLIRRLPADTDYAVVLTSGDEVFVAATAAETRQWAQGYGFDLDRTVAETEASNRVVPQHLLLSPDGRTLWRYIGHLEASEIEATLTAFRTGARRPDVR